MDKLDELQVFVTVVNQGSLAAAARELRRSPPAITRALAALESRFNTSLIERTTRRLSPTAAGLALFEKARTLLQDYDDALQHSRQSQLSGLLRLSAPVQFGRQHIAPLVLAFVDSYPDIQIELLLSDSYQDLIEQNLDMAVRIGQLRDSSLVAVEVGNVQRLLVASPALLAQMGAPATPDALVHYPLIGGAAPGAAREWRIGQQRVRITPRIVVNDVETQLIAARAGKGIARLLSYQVHADLQQGTLSELLTDHRPASVPVQLIAQNVQYMPARVRAFWDLAHRELPALDGFRR